MLIPAEENSNINIFENVYADIGDEQSINQNLSTFSSHMINVIDIVNHVNNNSLVLLDELGSGTDPVEGSSLAISIFDYLISKKCLLVSTSHYSELKIHAYNSKDIINASVEFDVNTLKPTYRLLIGVPGMSNAIQIASNLGLRKDILESAKDYVYKKNDNMSLVLDKMVNQSNLLDKKIKEVALEKEELQNKIALQDKEIAKTIEERNKVIQQANKEKDKLIEETRENLFDLLDEISDLKARGKSSIKEHEIADLKHKVRSLNENDLDENINPKDKEKEIVEGSNVYVRSYQAYGTVLKIHPNNKVDIQIGVLSMKVDKDDLIISEDQSKIKTINKELNRQPINLTRHVSPKLDLRGKRFEEAKELINNYLDDAFCASLKVVTIIHGFGTGTMRKLVQELLKQNKNVKEFHYGSENEGGFGATVVTFND